MIPNPPTKTTSADAGQTADWLRLIGDPTRPVELRAIGLDGKTRSGFFDNIASMAAEAVRLERLSKGVYFVLNPIAKIPAGRKLNVVERGKCTADADILERRWLPVDVDPVRKAGLSSTDVEKDEAFLALDRAARYLKANGFSDGIVGDSGNGAHLLYPIKLPNDEPSKLLVESFIKGLAKRFNTKAAHFDTSVGNASRIWKLYGTLARKGDSTAERPHRRSKIIAANVTPESDCTEALRFLVDCWQAEDTIDAEQPAPSNGSTFKRTAPNGTNRYAGAALDTQANRVRTAPNGQLWFTLRSAACSVGRYTPHGLQADVVLSRLLDAARDAGAVDLAHAEKTARSAIEAGSKNPKTAPSGNNGTGTHHGSNNGTSTNGATFDANGTAGANPPGGATTTGGQHANGTQAGGKPADKPPELIVTDCSTLKAKPIHYLVPGRIARGKMHLIAARGGLGKSTLMRSLAADISAGRCAFGLQYPDPIRGKVLLVCGEDGPEDVIVPGLLAENANMVHVLILEGIQYDKSRGPFTLDPHHVAIVSRYLAKHPDIVMVVIDPIATFIGRAKIDDHKAAELRMALDPLSELAESANVAVLLVAHVNKSAASAADRVCGSGAYRDAARAAYLVGPDPDDDDGRVLAPFKWNLAGFERTAVPFALVELGDHDKARVTNAKQLDGLSDDDRGRLLSQLKAVAFLPPKEVDIEDLMAPKRHRGGNKVGQCAEWLAEFLKEYAYPSDEINAAAESEGFTKDNVFRAKSKLKETSDLRHSNRGRFHGKWWSGFGHHEKWVIRPLKEEAPDIPESTDIPETPDIPEFKTLECLETFQGSEITPESTPPAPANPKDGTPAPGPALFDGGQPPRRKSKKHKREDPTR